jgi:TonB family protein
VVSGNGESSSLNGIRLGTSNRKKGAKMKSWARLGLLLGGSAIAWIVVWNVALAQGTAAPTIAPQNAPLPAEVVQWQTALATHLGRFKRYPGIARSRGEQGTATVAFTIGRDGRLINSRIVQSSGSPLLDEETLAMPMRAQPMPKPPSIASDSALSLAVPVRFDIK